MLTQTHARIEVGGGDCREGRLWMLTPLNELPVTFCGSKPKHTKLIRNKRSNENGTSAGANHNIHKTIIIHHITITNKYHYKSPTQLSSHFLVNYITMLCSQPLSTARALRGRQESIENKWKGEWIGIQERQGDIVAMGVAAWRGAGGRKWLSVLLFSLSTSVLVSNITKVQSSFVWHG